jgi:hypothetical protein
LFVLWFWFFKGALRPKTKIQIWAPLYAAKNIRKAPLSKWLTQQTNEIKLKYDRKEVAFSRV